MKLYHHLTQCRFLYRVNRFVARCEICGRETAVHVKNTGRLRELLLPGAEVWVEAGSNPDRKTAYDLVAVRSGKRIVNIDSQSPNLIVREWLESGGWDDGITQLRSEVVHGNSRYDFGYRKDNLEGLIEVKGVTLFDDAGMACFPDAPTERGVKHLQGLIRAAQAGMKAGVIFVVQREDAIGLRPNWQTHAAFGEALQEAERAGVRLTAAVCRVTPDSSTITGTVPVILTR